METYTQKNFDIGELKGISKQNIEEHLKLYAGYVKHTNLIIEKIREYKNSSTTKTPENAYIFGELQRRLGFEWNGMRNHEYYFESLEGGKKGISADGDFKKSIVEQYGNFDSWLESFKNLAMTRGIGWAVLYFDKKNNQFVETWIDEQHMGQLNGLSFVLGIDMWEHAYVYDYPTSEKKKYIEAFFENLNWNKIEKNFSEAK